VAEPVAGEAFVFTQFSGQPQCFLTEEQLQQELRAAGFDLEPDTPGWLVPLLRGEAGPGDPLYAPEPDGQRRGTNSHMGMERSSYTRAAMSDIARLMPLIAAGAVVAGAVRTMRRTG
jgi:hypothetical protein